MNEMFGKFERIVRLSHRHSDARSEPQDGLHPFDERNIHPDIQQISKDLFDNGHFTQATFEAFKFIETKVRKTSRLRRSGWELMMGAYGKDAPKTALNDLDSISYEDEQEGYKFIFGGSIRGIRNPRGHEYDIKDTLDECLDYLSLGSLLLRKLEDASS